MSIETLFFMRHPSLFSALQIVLFSGQNVYKNINKLYALSVLLFENSFLPLFGYNREN
jgi:hypothetical protein